MAASCLPERDSLHAFESVGSSLIPCRLYTVLPVFFQTLRSCCATTDAIAEATAGALCEGFCQSPKTKTWKTEPTGGSWKLALRGKSAVLPVAVKVGLGKNQVVEKLQAEN